MQTPIYDAESEQQLMSRLWSPQLKNDPLAFVLYAYPWGQKGTPLEHFKGPRKWQREVLLSIRDHIQANQDGEKEAASRHLEAAYEVLRDATVSGRGPGKSALVSWINHWFMSTRLGGTAIVSANSEAQLRAVTWAELTKWLAMAINSHWFEVSATRISPAKWLAELVEQELKVGTRYWAIEGRLWSEENPDSYAGVHNFAGVLLTFDEASGIPDTIWAVAAGFFTENTPNRFWFAFSNGRRPTGYFYECFHSKAEFWNTRSIDSRDVEGTDKQVYQQIIDEYGPESVQAYVEVYGMFPPTGEDQFISPHDVDEAMKRQPYDDDTAPIIMGVDPGSGRGRDHTAYVIRQGRNLLYKERNRNEDTMETAGRVIDLQQEWDADLVVIDDGGLGVGIIDRLKEQKFKWFRAINYSWAAKNGKMWANKKAELWGAMKEWWRTASAPYCKLLRRDVTTPERRFNSDGAMKVEMKKDLKARNQPSPDYGDALANTFAYKVGARGAHRKRVDKRRGLGHNQPAPSLTSWLGH